MAFMAFMGAMFGERIEMEAAGTELARALLERGVGKA
jgi:hypothetical protein